MTSSGLFHQARASTQDSSATPSVGEELSSDDGDGDSMMERHISAAKDGLIEMLTKKASKLGASLERAMVAKKESEDRALKLQVHDGHVVPA